MMQIACPCLHHLNCQQHLDPSRSVLSEEEIKMMQISCSFCHHHLHHQQRFDPSRPVLSEEEELHSEINTMQITCPYLHHLHHQQRFDPARDDNVISSISKVFGYLIPTLASVMGVYVEGTIKSLMETHSVSLCVSLVAIIIYYVAFVADSMSRRYQANSSQLWGLIAVIFGSLSVVSLVSTFFTHSVSKIICYVTLGYTVIFMVVYRYGRKLMNACYWLYHWFQAHYNNFSSPRKATTTNSVIEEV